MAGEPDKAKREVLAAEFYTNNKKFANCIGIFEVPQWVLYDAEEVVAWDQRPMANGNQTAMNNYRTIKLAK